mmetsp:Transcript_34269/g.83132  ORF Transcript_34269/g.83132 Transcript_34269/m.83132 type:complete len:90 (-) Transcript_34269:1655-1924(-)
MRLLLLGVLGTQHMQHGILMASAYAASIITTSEVRPKAGIFENTAWLSSIEPLYLTIVHPTCGIPLVHPPSKPTFQQIKQAPTSPTFRF